ncbi:MAG: class I SAM-dependent methyltransferase [bacterium]|nr:class I SAM-dependent methyltransferase [bacterium]
MQDGDAREESEVAVFAILEQGFDSLPISPALEQLNQLVALVLLLEAWAGKINLTGHRDAAAMTRGLVLDAAALAAALPELADARTAADLGTGAGFPGIPLAILFPATEFFLVDSRKKRNHFQREVRRRLSLGNVRPMLGRSDRIEQRPCDLVLAQAMAQPAEALVLMSQWAGRSGLLALPGSEASVPPDVPAGYREAELRRYRVPESGTERRLWVVTKDL